MLNTSFCFTPKKSCFHVQESNYLLLSLLALTQSQSQSNGQKVTTPNYLLIFQTVVYLGAKAWATQMQSLNSSLSSEKLRPWGGSSNFCPYFLNCTTDIPPTTFLYWSFKYHLFWSFPDPPCHIGNLLDHSALTSLAALIKGLKTGKVSSQSLYPQFSDFPLISYVISLLHQGGGEEEGVNRKVRYFSKN